jgi:hypothetical protein
MSVVQISRIQQRRGKKNTDYGFPQLASGELGWAIDTQELYIGNGAVSEGAPYVGNSKIITEHDDILQFVASYQYKKNTPSIQTGSVEVAPVKRSLQTRLDDLVSVKAFGAVGDGVIDDTAAIQRAIFQLFLNSATKDNKSSRVVLYMEPGEYKISSELKIPPYTHIVGAGIDSTIIIQSIPPVTNPVTPVPESVFKMVANNPTPDLQHPELSLDYTEFGSMNSLQRPRYILISGLTLETNNANRLVYLDNTDSTLFDRVKFVGSYVNGTNPVASQSGVEMRGTSEQFRNDNVLFNFCIFNNTGYGIFSNSDHNNISVDNCVFSNLYDAINIGGGQKGSVNTKITSCYFDLIDRYGIWIKLGYGNTSTNNKFMNVGNNFEGYANATYPVIKFDTDSNQTTGDYFERNTLLKDQNTYAFLPFIANVETSSLVYDNNSFHKDIFETAGSALVFLRLPLYNSGRYVIDYVINKNTNGDAIRSGILNISVDFDNKLSDLFDNFGYTGDTKVENIVFSVGLQTYRNDPGATTPDTLTINIFNPPSNGTGTMNYTYRMLSQ